MPTKLLLILANSLKRGGRCIAGREVLWRPDARWYLGPWIRPVGTHGQGELHLAETLLPDATPVQVLDFAAVTLQQHEGRADQPENWLVSGDGTGIPPIWAKPDRIVKPPPLHALEEHPANLWIDKAEMNDRISPHRLQELHPGSSLAIIKPQDLTVAWWTEQNAVKNRPQHKYQARFHYHDLYYRLSLTDPLATARLCTPMPPLGAPPLTATIPDEPLLCISLTPVFGGFHYKVAATILECGVSQ